MNPTPALKFLRTEEWEMGNGQCPECYGCRPYKGWTTETVGHRPVCQLAKSIVALGGDVVWERVNHSKKRRALHKFWGSTIKEAKVDMEAMYIKHLMDFVALPPEGVR